MGAEFRHSSDLAQTLHWYSSVPIGIVLSLIGLVGNIISIIIWTRITKSTDSRKTRNTGTYLIVLAVADSLLLVFFLLQDSLKAMIPDVVKSYEFAIFYSYVAFPFFFFFIFASIWLVVSVTYDR